MEEGGNTLIQWIADELRNRRCMRLLGFSIGGPWGFSALRCKAHLPHRDGCLPIDSPQHKAVRRSCLSVLNTSILSGGMGWVPKGSPRLLLSPSAFTIRVLASFVPRRGGIYPLRHNVLLPEWVGCCDRLKSCFFSPPSEPRTRSQRKAVPDGRSYMIHSSFHLNPRGIEKQTEITKRIPDSC